ncbi:MAG: hypothetical protein IJH87_01920 [Atopobiaceae bacterium]|nr:hypothetical protein [Atopobiaceae bacterium]
MTAGNQVPTFRHVLDYSRTEGDACIAFCRSELCIEFDLWQENILRDWLAVHPVLEGGEKRWRYVHLRNGLEVPRQNGKTAIVEGRIIFGAAVKGEQILYTAHDYSTVQKLFDRLKMFFGERKNDANAPFPRLNRIVRAVRLATGKEAIFLKNGGAIYLSTRTKSSKRGYTVDVVVADESQELTEIQAKAILSTASSSPLHNPQYIFTGTPPGPESSGVTFMHMRDKLMSGSEANDISWSEWSVDELGDITDESRWMRVNPAMGVRIDADIIRSQMETFKDPLSFAQECLGYWLPKTKLQTVIEADKWDACFTDSPPSMVDRKKPDPETVICYAVRFSPDNSTGALSVCLKKPGELPYIQCIRSFEMLDGIEWLVDWLIQRKDIAAQVVVDGRSNAGDLHDRLLRAGMSKKALIVPGASDAISAYSLLLNSTKEGNLRHSAGDALTRSATGTAMRKIGNTGGFGFQSTDEADATLIESCALALWAASNTKRRPGRKVVVY